MNKFGVLSGEYPSYKEEGGGYSDFQPSGTRGPNIVVKT